MHNSTMKISNAQCLGTPSYLPTYFFPLLPILVRLFSFAHRIHHRVFHFAFQARRARQVKILPFVDIRFRLFHINRLLEPYLEIIHAHRAQALHRALCLFTRDTDFFRTRRLEDFLV